MSVSHSITGGLVHLSGNPIQITLTADAVKTNHKLAVKVTCDALMGSPFVEEIAPVLPPSHFKKPKIPPRRVLRLFKKLTFDNLLK